MRTHMDIASVRFVLGRGHNPFNTTVGAAGVDGPLQIGGAVVVHGRVGADASGGNVTGGLCLNWQGTQNWQKGKKKGEGRCASTAHIENLTVLSQRFSEAKAKFVVFD